LGRDPIAASRPQTLAGGANGYGTVFGLSSPLPQPTIILSGTNVILTWPTNVDGFSYAGFTLQSTTNLVSPAVWTTANFYPCFQPILDGKLSTSYSHSRKQLMVVSFN
jgi:hypothetical protein